MHQAEVIIPYQFHSRSAPTSANKPQTKIAGWKIHHECKTYFLPVGKYIDFFHYCQYCHVYFLLRVKAVVVKSQETVSKTPDGNWWK